MKQTDHHYDSGPGHNYVNQNETLSIESGSSTSRIKSELALVALKSGATQYVDEVTDLMSLFLDN